MKPTFALRRIALGAVLSVVTLALLGALQKGSTVYSKRNETRLLAEPKPLAATTTSAGFAEALKIDEVRGTWLHVTGKKGAGWVFSGNVAEEEPKLAPSAGLTTVAASETDTVAAARPLSAVGTSYAERHGATEPKADVDWLDREAARTTDDDVEIYLIDNQKGEYQP